MKIILLYSNHVYFSLLVPDSSAIISSFFRCIGDVIVSNVIILEYRYK